MKALTTTCLFLTTLSLFAEETEPIFGGTLLSTIPVNIAPAHWLVEPYLYIIKQTGHYTSHWQLSHNPQFTIIAMPWDFETGITNWLDIAFYPTVAYVRSSYLYGDTKVALGIQISREQKGSWIPNFRLILTENFPTGKYDHLNPHKHLSDVSGSGAYETWFSSVLHKTVLPFTLNLTLNYSIPSNVHVQGFSLYGGPANTTIRPGQQFIGNLGIEYSLTTFWILGLDLHYQHQNSSSHPTPNTGTPSLEQFSLAPCIEYNPSPSIGLELGSWFTVSGRNSTAFTSAIGTIYLYF